MKVRIQVPECRVQTQLIASSLLRTIIEKLSAQLLELVPKYCQYRKLQITGNNYKYTTSLPSKKCSTKEKHNTQRYNNTQGYNNTCMHLFSQYNTN